MRIVAVRSIPNVDNDRLVADLLRLGDRLKDPADSRRQWIEDAARRCLIAAELTRRGAAFDYPLPHGNPTVCAEYFARQAARNKDRSAS